MPPPKPGDVWTYEVNPGRAVLFRCVAADADTRCVVLTKWEGEPPKKLPRAKTLKEVQPLKHHAWDRPMIGGWVREGPPPEVVLLGRAEVTRTERSRVMHPRDFVAASNRSDAMGKKVLPMASWPSLLRDAKAQWRWDHDREAVLAEEAAVQAQKQEAYERAVAEEIAKKLLARR